MNIFCAILSIILTPLAISVIIPWMYGLSKKEEAQNGFVSKTKFPKHYTVCSLIALIITTVLFIVGTILISIFEKDFPIHSWIAFILAMLFIISIPLLMVLISFFTCEIIRDDGILLKGLFKKKFIAYSQMASYKYSLNQLTVYDCEHKALFGVYDNRVGMKSLINQLDIKGIFRE